ncbi:MAG: hypothetical protein ACAI44_32585, partial [Candidatus Sericytochromatia bacterium]
AIQEAFASEFDKVWRGKGERGLLQHAAPLEEYAHELEKINRTPNVETGWKRFFMPMVPQDDNYPVLAPDGSVRPAGEVELPSDSDGVMGWLSQLGNSAGNLAVQGSKQIVNARDELKEDVAKGYARDGIKGAIQGLFQGDASQLPKLKQAAMAASIEGRAQIIKELLGLGVTRAHHEQLIFDILHDTGWEDFPKLVNLLDMRQLASELENDQQAGEVLSWIAKVEVTAKGQTGVKFDLFATYLAEKHRQGALDAFLGAPHTRDSQLQHKIPGSLMADLVQKLMDGHTDTDEENTIYRLFEAASWEQTDAMMRKLNMSDVASELQHGDRQLAKVLKWSLQSAIQVGRWGRVEEILSHLEGAFQYFRADNVVGHALADLQDQDLARLPQGIHDRLQNLVDDISRKRSDDAVSADKRL